MLGRRDVGDAFILQRRHLDGALGVDDVGHRQVAQPGLCEHQLAEFAGIAGKLRRLDQVAYVRFASVYRQFKTLEELVDEAKAVLDARRYEDPDQGSLFIEPKPHVAESSNGSPTKSAAGTEVPPARHDRKSRNSPKTADDGEVRPAKPVNSEPAATESV